MALSGTLADIGIVELIQFPSNGRKTGELIIAGTDDEARLYYIEGALVHVVVDESSGMEGLVEVVSWSTGEFEFRMGVESESRTIDLDLHRALMMALKTRDERAEAARNQSNIPESHGSSLSEKAIALLEQTVSSSDAIVGAYLISEEGDIIAKEDNKDENDLEKVMHQMAAFFKNYPRSPLGRVFLDDIDGILHASRVGGNRIAVISGNKDVPMGVVSMMMNKLVTGMVGIE